MAGNGAAGFVNASVMLPGGSAFALAAAASGAPPAAALVADDVHVVAGAVGDVLVLVQQLDHR